MLRLTRPMYGDVMEQSGLEALLAVNGIDLESGHQVLYEALRLQCFAQVCDVLREDRGTYLHALQSFRRRMNPTAFAEEMVIEHCECRLDEESYVVLGKLFAHFFRKDDVRITYPETLRKRLAFQQDYRCAICGKAITYTANLDHIIPWVYVGDTLDDNLQLLCRACNSKKRASLIYPLQVLLQRGKRKPEDSNCA